MNAHSLKSRQLLAALRTLPECRPHNVNGVSAYVNPMRPVYEPKQFMQCLGRASRTPRALPPTNIAKEVVR